jgi:hypothetical protein
VRDHSDRPGFRSRQITLVPTRLDAAIYRVADRAALYRQRWQGETSLAHLKTTRRLAGWPCQTVPGGLKARTVWALVDNVVRMVMWHAALRQHLAVERRSCLEARRGLGAPRPGMP